MEDSHKTCVRDLNWAIGLNRFCLRLMGIWPDPKKMRMKSMTGLLGVPLMILMTFCFVFLPQMYALVLVSDDFLLIMDNFMTSCPAAATCVKLFIFWRSKEVLRPVVNSITGDWLRPKDEWERQIMRDEAKVAKLFTIGGYVFMTCSYSGFVVAPLFGLNIRVITNLTDYGSRHLLFQSYYPYDYSVSPNFELTHISQLFGGICISMAMAIPDNYFGALVFHLSAQFRILGLSIEHCVKSDNNNSFVVMGNKSFSRSLRDYVNRHVHLITMVSAVERSFTLMLLTQLFCLCGMACCLGFRILYTLGSTDEQVPIFQILNLVAALISLMMFTLVDCTASEALATNSTGLHDNIYSSKWYAIPKDNARDLILMMVMSKNPQSLTAGKIFYLSMSTYCQIMKSIAGYISVLIASSTA